MIRTVVRPSGILLSLVVAACLGNSSAPELIGEGTRILFIGNSHTYVNDVPGILQALADSAGGETIATLSISTANYALIDHWNDGAARREIEKGSWRYVVMQQGWTPAGVCRDTLRLATQLFAERIRSVGATPAVTEIWAPASRPGQTLGTIESYRLAAEDVNGLLFPVAEAWQEFQVRYPGNVLYQDDIHANEAGSYLAALVMYARIFNRSPVGLPRAVETRNGTTISLSAAMALDLQLVAADIGLAATPRTDPVAQPVITNRC
jgi:hypothetical protein